MRLYLDYFKNIDIHSKIISLTLLCFAFVLPIEETIAIRLFLELILIVYFVRSYSQWKNYLLVLPILIIFAITFWIAIHNIFLTYNYVKSWSEYNSQWIRPSALFVVGIWLSSSKNNKLFIFSLISGFALSIFCQIVDSLYLWAQSGHFPFQVSRLTGSKANISYVLNIVAGCGFSYFFYNLIIRKNSLKVDLLRLFIFILFIGAVALQIGARNGVAGLILTLISLTFLYVYENKYEKGVTKLLIVFASISIIVSAAYLNIKFDSRWNSFIDTAKYAFNIEIKPQLIEPSAADGYIYNKMPNGQMIDGSAFARIMMFREGVEVVKQYPWGFGFDRGAWGEGVSKIFSLHRSGHSHSGLLDWTVSLGYLGLILWLGFIFSLIFYSIKSWLEEKNQYSLFLCLITSGFFIRSLVDSNIRDYSFELFMITAGLLYFQNKINPANPVIAKK